MNVRLLHVICFLALFSISLTDLSAQGFCGNTGGFTITPTSGCAPLTVQVSNQVHKAESLTYAFEFDRAQTTAPSAGQATQDSTYTYTKPGNYTILQYGSAGGTGFSQCADVQVFETGAPSASLITCPNGKAMLSIVSNEISEAYDFITVDWGDGTQQSVNMSGQNVTVNHEYVANANPTVKINGRYSNGSCEQNVNVTSLTGSSGGQTLAGIRIRNVEMAANGEVKLLYDGIDGITTEVLIDKGDGKFVATGKSGQAGGTQAVSITGLNAAVSYRFQLASMDICGNPVRSDIVSSLVLKEVPMALDEILSVSWEHLSNTENVVEYQLKRNGAVIFSTPDQLSYQDTDVRCGEDYEYEIVAVIKNDVRSYSAPLKLQPKTAAPEVISQASVTVESDQKVVTRVELVGEGLTNSYNLIIERAALGSNNFEQVSPATNQTLQFEDMNVNAGSQSYCYRFQYENACKLKSPAFSEPVCSILLQSGAQDVRWNAESPFTGAAIESYELRATREDGSLLDLIPMQLSTTHQLDLNAPPVYAFQVRAQATSPGLESFSNILPFRRDAIVQVPDAFTPNGDAYNERFEIKGYFISEYHLSIFSRWGEVVFQSNDIGNSWDGNIKTGKAPGGYYLYKLDLTDSAGQQSSKEGSFLLIR